jgi:hypothetical protein
VADDHPCYSEACMVCEAEFGIIFNPRHHCRYCGWLVCGQCSPFMLVLDRHIPVGGRKVGETSSARRNAKAAGEAMRRVCAECHRNAPAEMQARADEMQRIEAHA